MSNQTIVQNSVIYDNFAMYGGVFGQLVWKMNLTTALIFRNFAKEGGLFLSMSDLDASSSVISKSSEVYHNYDVNKTAVKVLYPTGYRLFICDVNVPYMMI